jgi:hypothetical protein
MAAAGRMYRESMVSEFQCLSNENERGKMNEIEEVSRVCRDQRSEWVMKRMKHPRIKQYEIDRDRQGKKNKLKRKKRNFV